MVAKANAENAGARSGLWRVLLVLGLATPLVWWYVRRGEEQVVRTDWPQFPVAGRVTVAGVPLRRGVVSLVPDRSRGTTHMNRPSGEIQADGTYRLTTWNRPGAPEGAYRVLVASTKTPMPPFPAPMNYVPDWAHAEKYVMPDSTDLFVDVLPDAPEGAYDFDLSP